ANRPLHVKTTMPATMATAKTYGPVTPVLTAITPPTASAMVATGGRQAKHPIATSSPVSVKPVAVSLALRSEMSAFDIKATATTPTSPIRPYLLSGTNCQNGRRKADTLDSDFTRAVRPAEIAGAPSSTLADASSILNSHHLHRPAD